MILWGPPRAQITGYRLFLVVEGSSPKQLRIPARLNQYTLLNLQPDTHYTATLHAERDNVLSEGATGVFTTSELHTHTHSGRPTERHTHNTHHTHRHSLSHSNTQTQMYLHLGNAYVP